MTVMAASVMPGAESGRRGGAKEWYWFTLSARSRVTDMGLDRFAGWEVVESIIVTSSECSSKVRL